MINSLIVVGKSPHETTEFVLLGATVRVVVAGAGYRCYEYIDRLSAPINANGTWNKVDAEAVAAQLQAYHRLHFVPRTTEQAEPAGRRITKGGHHKVMNHDG
jgi:hypothetical protein